MRVLGIETSCDETAASVVTDSGRVLSDVVHSQVDVHAPYGGIVPELASRDHLTNIRYVVTDALRKAATSLASVDGIAVTCRPGLTGALMVGVETAKGLAWAAEKPLVGVDHLVGHLVAAHLEFDADRPAAKPPLPFIGLIASGGHTALYRVDALEAEGMRELGATRDDAAGEAFDKVAKLLGLGYPGGPVIDRLASEGDAEAVTLSRPMPQRASLEFSFSGLKSNVARWVADNGRPGNDRALRDLCAAFQRRVVDTLVSKAVRAAAREKVGVVVLGGGVAANRELRRRAADATRQAGLELFVPPFRACTDNAAMIAFAGIQRLRRGDNDAALLEVSPRTLLPRVTRKGRGARAHYRAATRG